MTTWPEVRETLLATYANEAADAGFLALRLTGGDRTQTVFVNHHEGTNRGAWVRIESGFAQVSQSALAVAIDHIGQDENLWLGIGRLADHLVVRWTGFVATHAIADFVTMVDGVAGVADALERRVSGTDQY